MEEVLDFRNVMRRELGRVKSVIRLRGERCLFGEPVQVGCLECNEVRVGGMISFVYETLYDSSMRKYNDRM